MPDIKKNLLEALKNEYDNTIEFSNKQERPSIRHESEKIAKGVLLAMRMVSDSLEDMVIVPEKPTKEMLDAAEEWLADNWKDIDNPDDRNVRIGEYIVMLSAYQGADK